MWYYEHDIKIEHFVPDMCRNTAYCAVSRKGDISNGFQQSGIYLPVPPCIPDNLRAESRQIQKCSSFRRQHILLQHGRPAAARLYHTLPAYDHFQFHYRRIYRRLPESSQIMAYRRHYLQLLVAAFFQIYRLCLREHKQSYRCRSYC